VNTVDFSGVLSTVLTITTIIGVALAGLQRGVVTNLREAAADLRLRDADRAKREADLEAENVALKADLTALGRVVTGEAYLTALGDRLDEHHAEAKQFWHASSELGMKILDEIHHMREGS
jgi:hypothetical protein